MCCSVLMVVFLVGVGVYVGNSLLKLVWVVFVLLIVVFVVCCFLCGFVVGCGIRLLFVGGVVFLGCLVCRCV